MVATVMPMAAAGHNLALAFLLSPDDALMLSTNLNSIVLDYCVRQKVGRPSLDYFVVKQLPVLEPESLRKSPGWTDLTGSDWLRPRAIELLYTAFQLAQFAKDAGYDGPPFQWHENRRFLIRCEVDAAFFHFYGIARDDVDYIMDTFPIVRRKDEQRFGEYRTKRVILEIYDEMERAKVSGKPYQSRLDPPPGDPRAAHQVTGQEEKGEPADAV